VRIPAFVDGELVEPELSRVREHVADCPRCGAAARLEQGLADRLRATVGSETAPPSLLGRVRAGLDEIPAPTPAVKPAVLPSRRARPSPPARGTWSLLTAAAAAVLVLLALPWGTADSGLVTAMAAEHSRRVDGNRYRGLSLVTDSTGDIESYLTEELGVEVDIPLTSVPKKRGASCGSADGRKLGIVGCFCGRRNRAVTIFVVRAAGLDLRGMTRAVRGGREFYCGSSGTCQVVLWFHGKLCYALAGDLQPADLRDMAYRACRTLEKKAGAAGGKHSWLDCTDACACGCTKRSAG
jgi:anti-sigma factor RsiW